MRVDAPSPPPTGSTPPVRPALPRVGGTPTDVTVEWDPATKHQIVTIVDQRTREVLAELPPRNVRYVVQELLELIRQREAARWPA